MGVVKNMFIRARLFRRSHKSCITLVIAFTLLLFVLSMLNLITLPESVDLDGHYSFATSSQTTHSKVDDNGEALGFFESIKNKLWNKKKTIPFAKTGAAHSSDFHSIIKKTSGAPLTQMSDDNKLKLIVESHKKIDPDNKRLIKGHKYYESILKVLTDGKPKTDQLKRYLSHNRIYHARYEYSQDQNPIDSDENVIFSEQYLSQFLQLTTEEMDSMKESHRYVVNNLKDTAPDGLYKGDGIVFVGGGKFNWLTLLSIKSIRAIGSDLPIEVLIPKLDEYEPDLCARVFPALNARCIYLPYVLSGEGSPISNIKFKGYQYKALAIMLSSFENILLLDSDNIPVHPPDYLFKSEPFTSKGLIVWPDFWRRATSPAYYKIAGINIDDKKLLPKYNEKKGEYEAISPSYKIENLETTPLHQRVGAIPDPTSESGQLMISKKTHMKALLLALYYNMYGPSHYYPLFSQGSDGEGDKETFLAATVALKQPFYQVSKFLNAFGYFNAKSEFVGTGMGQYDPVEDWLVNLRKSTDKNMKEKDSELYNSQDNMVEKGPRILFVHANFPKLNPWLLKTEGKIFNENNERIRLYGTGMKLRTGYDFETVQWSNMKFLLCELNIELKAYQNVNRTELCDEIYEHLQFLKSTIKTLE